MKTLHPRPEVTNDERPAPNDLMVLVSHPAGLDPLEIAAIDALDWYQPDRDEHPRCQNMILVSARLAPESADLVDVFDCGMIELRAVERIDDCLHRWDAEDGFYHA